MLNKLMENIDKSDTFRIILTFAGKFWPLILLIIAIILSRKNDDFIPLSKVKGFIKK